MDIRATGTLIRLPALVISIAAITSACSGIPWLSPDSNVSDQQSQTYDEQSSTVAEPTEHTAELAQSTESVAVASQSIRIKADYPQQYTVVKGDTLWDISAKFLKDPWYWPEIWQRNPQVKNPHLIYPGDILTLIYVNGIPQIQITRGDEIIRSDTQARTENGLSIVKLSPGIRRISRDSQIPTIPSDAISQFISRPKVVTRKEIDDAPYIVSSDEAHLILASDNKIYIRGELDKERVRYSIYRRGSEFIDPESGDILGYEVIYAGEARIDVYGDPATAIITSSRREILVGDFLMTTDKSDVNTLFFPRIPEQKVEGQIISLFDALSSVASFQIVVINRGASEGIEVGHLLASYYKGGAARDKYLSRKKVKRGEEKKLIVQLPDERSGLMMVFRVFDRVSYALILESTRVIRKLDVVRTPH